MKPENVILMENGHVKITDFGACRSVTEAGSELLQSNYKLLHSVPGSGLSSNSDSFSFFDSIRDGGWRERSAKAVEIDDVDGIVIDTIVELEINSGKKEEESGDPMWGLGDKNNVEGTPGYLPPEVLSEGMLPNQMADSWALGCTIEFCLTGRPPFYGDITQVLHQIQNRAIEADSNFETCSEAKGVRGGVQFDLDASSSRSKRARRTVPYSVAPTTYDTETVIQLDSAVRSLLSRLICVDSKHRMRVEEALHNSYFTGILFTSGV